MARLVEAIGHGVRTKRSRLGAVNFDLLDTKGGMALSLLVGHFRSHSEGPSIDPTGFAFILQRERSWRVENSCLNLVPTKVAPPDSLSNFQNLSDPICIRGNVNDSSIGKVESRLHYVRDRHVV